MSKVLGVVSAEEGGFVWEKRFLSHPPFLRILWLFLKVSPGTPKGRQPNSQVSCQMILCPAQSWQLEERVKQKWWLTRLVFEVGRRNKTVEILNELIMKLDYSRRS